MKRPMTPHQVRLDAGPYAPALGESVPGPSSVTGLELWFTADYGLFQDDAGTTPATADTDPVGYWTDKSGNGRHAVQATGTAKPRLALSAVNTRPAVDFDGGDGLFTVSFAGTIAQPLSIYAVVAFDGSYGLNRIVYDGDATARCHLYAVSAAGHWTMFAGLNVEDPAASPGVGTWYRTLAEFNGASSKLFLGDTEQLTGDPGAQGLHSFCIGANYVPNAWIDGRIAEIMAYSKILSADEKTVIADYLTGRYGV